MRHSSKKQLIDQGRKAGLRTSEIYSAMSSRPAELGDATATPADSNGFVLHYDGNGQTSYRPATGTGSR